MFMNEGTVDGRKRESTNEFGREKKGVGKKREGGELRVDRGSDFKLAIRLESFWNTGLDRQRRYSS